MLFQSNRSFFFNTHHNEKCLRINNACTYYVFAEEKRKNFIDILLNSDVFKDFPEEKLVDEVVTFILAVSIF